MTENAFGDFFLDDSAGALSADADEPIVPPVVVPGAPRVVEADSASTAVPSPTSVPVVSPIEAPPAPSPRTPVPIGQPAILQTAHQPPRVAAPVQGTPAREERLAKALDRLMQESLDVQAAALVSLDGFTMASALPEGMQEDRVGAMSAAILGLGERAAAELGRGKLSQVFIEADNGYVLLVAAGKSAVLTCLADADAKLGLVIYDMRAAAESIAEILG